MATAPVSPSPLCRPEEDPFLLLESTFHAVQDILASFQGCLLRRSWLERPYGEEEITLPEEELLPALKSCLARIGELDEHFSLRWRSGPTAASKMSASRSPS